MISEIENYLNRPHILANVYLKVNCIISESMANTISWRMALQLQPQQLKNFETWKTYCQNIGIG
jgi:hypothetical protein